MKRTHPKPSVPRLAVLLGLAVVSSSHAQTTAPAAAPKTSADEETVLLSPFEVNTKKDVGYLAGNTLAGSRLNTSLMDTGAAISVLTTEFLRDIGATNMKDVILFQNNAVPDVGDAASNVNGNPLIGADEWQLRIRGLAASYARNYFKWDTSSDFYNVERIDQARGPNSILFGFGAGGGIVNTSTKQARLYDIQSELAFTVGSWDRYRGTIDFNQVLTPKELALRVNAVAENGKTWREFEFDNSRRAHLALKYQPTKTSSLRAEVEVGKVKDNVARPWLATDQSSVWRAAGRPTVGGTWAAWSPNYSNFWPDHLVVADDGTVRNWIGRAYANNSTGGSAATNWNNPTWAAIAPTPANLAIIPMNSNLAGPDAVRETKYNTFSAFYENQVSEQFSFEIALNHQSTDFLGYDADGGRATNYYGNSSELFGDASSDLPDSSGNYVSANPNAGKLYLENNWTRRDQHIKGTQVRATAAYTFDTGTWAKHRAAALLEHSVRDFYRREDAEVFTNMPLDKNVAEADVNRIYRRHYFKPGNTQDIHVASWRSPIANRGWAPNQPLENTTAKQDTGMVAVQSNLFSEKLVTILGYRYDSMDYTYDIGAKGFGTRDAVSKQFRLDPASERSSTFNASTLSAGAVYHATQGVSLYGNLASSRDVPDVRIHVIGSDLPPMPESRGSDIGVKLSLFDGKLYATAGYYTTKVKHASDWGNVQSFATDRNTKILGALQSAGLITTAERDARLINANGYLQDRDAKGWEFQTIANPTPNWRITANFAINNVVGYKSMAEVKAWADTNSAFWLAKAASKGGTAFLTGSPADASWDTLGNQIGWMNDSIKEVTGLDGREVRGQRKYGGNLYTKYTFSDGALKGFSIGGGGRYQSANILGYYYNAIRKGTDLVLADASLGYGMKADFIKQRAWLDLQFNVSNLFDTDKSQIYTLAWWDPSAKTPGNIGLQEPRKISLTASLKF